MRHLSLEGSYYQMGYEYGEILRKVGFRLPEMSVRKLDLGRGCHEAVERFFPEALKEFKVCARDRLFGMKNKAILSIVLI